MAEGRARTPSRYDYSRPENARRLSPAGGSAGPRGEVRYDATRSQKRAARAQGARVQRSPEAPTGAPPGRTAERQLPSPKAYGNVILMEFIGTLLLTVLTPWARQNHVKGASPYKGAEMVKLAAIVLLFFLLSAVASASAGAARMAAWLGGLVLIADGLYEASNIAKDFQIFTGGLASAAGADTAGAAPAANPDGTLPIATMPVSGSGSPSGETGLFPVVSPPQEGGGGGYPVP